jgi:transcriptional regulator with XRE-family HTH domain
MMEPAHPIDLNLVQKLGNREYRQKFFLAESSAHIAEQLIALRKRRGLDQTQLAEMIGTQQPAISRVEKADYQNWSFNTLRKIADAEDARVRVTIQPAEDVLKEYEPKAVEQPIKKETWTTNVWNGLNETMFGARSALTLHENAELRRENANLKEENALLKSALQLHNPLSAAQEGADVAHPHAWLCTQQLWAKEQMPPIPRGITAQEQRIGAS